jgi:TP53 regulating kinase-like protein
LKLAGEGAEAKIYQTTFFKEKVMVKRRIEKKYRVKALDEAIRKERTKKEAKILANLYLSGVNCPKLIFCDPNKYEIYFSIIKGKLARNSKLERNFFKKAGEQLALMHEGGVIHGDYTTSNLMISKGKVYVIDFGLSDFSKIAEEQATDLLLFKKGASGENFKEFTRAYAKIKKNASGVFKKMSEIEKRGRYVVRKMT